MDVRLELRWVRLFSSGRLAFLASISHSFTINYVYSATIIRSIDEIVNNNFVSMSLKSVIFHRSKEAIIGSKEIRTFADIVGDHNPVHLDAEYAAKTRFKAVISHGMLGAGYIYSLIPPHMRIEQFEIKFRRPIYASDKVKVEL